MSIMKVKAFKWDLLSYYFKGLMLLFIGAVLVDLFEGKGWIALLIFLPYILMCYVAIQLLKYVYIALKEINYSISPLVMCISLFVFPPLIFYIYFTYKNYYLSPKSGG